MYKMQLYLEFKVFGVKCDLGQIYKQISSLCFYDEIAGNRSKLGGSKVENIS
jgi:hypothetical protein